MCIRDSCCGSGDAIGPVPAVLGIALFISALAAGGDSLAGICLLYTSNARKVFNDDIFMSFQAAFLFFHGDAGPVPDVLVGACQGVKERGFPAVGVARQGDGNVCLLYTSRCV